MRYGPLSQAGTIRSAVHDTSDGKPHPHLALPPDGPGTLRLDLILPGHGPLGRALDALYGLPGVDPGPAPEDAPETRPATAG